MARDLKKALERLEQALDEEEREEEYEEEETWDEEDCEEDEYEEDEEYEEEYEDEAPEEEDASPEPGVRHGCLKALALILMTAIAVMLLIITMKIKGLIP